MENTAVNMKALVKSSIECKWRLRQVKIACASLCCTIVAMLLISLYAGLQPGINGISSEVSGMETAFFIFGVLSAVFTACFLPIICYYSFQYYKLFHNCESYELYQVMLDRPDTAVFYRGAIYYRVSFVTDRNEHITLDTKPLWSGSAFSDFQLDAYNNKKVRVLYDRENERVIVVG